MEEKEKITLLLDQLKGADGEKALDALAAIYYRPLKRYLSLIIKDERIALELLSDVFLAVWKNRDQILYPGSFNTYIYRIAKYKAIKFLSRDKIETVGFDSVPIELFDYVETISPEDAYISKENIHRINEAIETLPPQCKMAFKLVREDRMTYGDAAEVMGISIGTLNTYIYRAVKIIRTKLTE
ncbi:MAG: sigma-70 family RNA polymerase sigma factor [Tannerellaceae bacterium]|nr:sigma-70 family RNA polymerase sigma factor [Tannerellaceae bacterium]